MTRSKNPAWVRSQLPDDIKLTFVVSRHNDPFLHTYLAGVPFRGASAEIRRLLKVALQVEASGGLPQKEVGVSEPPKAPVVIPTLSAPVPRVEKTGAKEKERALLHENERSPKSALSQEDLNAIAMLDEMSG